MPPAPLPVMHSSYNNNNNNNNNNNSYNNNNSLGCSDERLLPRPQRAPSLTC